MFLLGFFFCGFCVIFLFFFSFLSVRKCKHIKKVQTATKKLRNKKNSVTKQVFDDKTSAQKITDFAPNICIDSCRQNMHNRTDWQHKTNNKCTKSHEETQTLDIFNGCYSIIKKKRQKVCEQKL